MNLLKFAHRTAPLPLYAIPAVFVFGAASVATIDITGALAVFFAGVALFLAFLLGTALHRARLIHLSVSGLLLRILVNGEQGHLPHMTAREGAKAIDEITNDPIKPWESN